MAGTSPAKTRGQDALQIIQARFARTIRASTSGARIAEPQKGVDGRDKPVKTRGQDALQIIQARFART